MLKKERKEWWENWVNKPILIHFTSEVIFCLRYPGHILYIYHWQHFNFFLNFILFITPYVSNRHLFFFSFLFFTVVFCPPMTTYINFTLNLYFLVIWLVSFWVTWIAIFVRNLISETKTRRNNCYKLNHELVTLSFLMN